MRETDPVRWLAFDDGTDGAWLVARYEHVAAAIKDPRLSKDPSRLVPPEHLSPLDRAMLFRDPPDHARLRSLVGQAFTPRSVRSLESRIAAIVEDLLIGMRARSNADFMADFAIPLPVIVIAELLGVPVEDRASFRAWSDVIVEGGDGAATPEEHAARYRAAMASLTDYFARTAGERRERRRDDLISGLIDARDRDDRLSEDELVGTCILLLVAGHETTVNLLGNGLLSLLRHPEQLALLREHPELIPGAVEEMLRFESPVQQSTFRVTVEGIEIGDVRIGDGQQVIALLGAANRDPARFPHPDTFDVARELNRHLAFGSGIHFCLGAPLARAEARIAFSRLLDAFPEIRLLDAEPAWGANSFLRGLTSLPIAV
jgi:cytochrome P450